jgi:hypothetical protein
MGAKFGPPTQAGSASFGSASLRLTSLHLPGGLKPQYNYLITVTQRTLYYQKRAYALVSFVPETIAYLLFLNQYFGFLLMCLTELTIITLPSIS